MIKSYKNRELKKGDIVEVYRNLHNDLFSIRDKKTKLVLAHGNNFSLWGNCKFIVNDGGRKLVNKNMVKNVHAWIEGEFLSETSQIRLLNMRQLTYNPYKNNSFIDTKNKEKLTILNDTFVYFIDGKCYYV